MNKIFKTLILCSLTFSVIFPNDFDQSITQEIVYKKEHPLNIFLLLCGPCPGVSLSLRRQVISYDFSIQSVLFCHSLSCTASPTLHLGHSKIRPYVSVGAGPYFLINTIFGRPHLNCHVIIPARLGIESPELIGDIGIASIVDFDGDLVTLPEARVGVKF